jgi:hypothetical protein
LNKKTLFLWLKLVITITALTWLFMSGKLRIDQLAVRSGGWPWIAAAVGLIFGWMVLSLVRYWWLLRCAGVAVTMGRVLQVAFISWFLNATLFGGLGFASSDAIKAAYLVRDKKSGSGVIGATLIDRTLGLLGLMTLAVFALQVGWEQTVQSPELRRVAAIIYGVFAMAASAIVLSVVSLVFDRRVAFIAWILLGGVATVLLSMIWMTVWIPVLMMMLPLTVAMLAPALLPGNWLHRVIVERMWFGGVIGSFLETLLGYRKRIGTLLGAYGLSIVVHVTSLLALGLTAKGIAIEEVPSLGQIWFAAPPATALNVVPLPANGLGVGEAAFDTMLRFCAGPNGAPLTGGAALFLSYRILLTLSGLSGLPFYLTSRKARQDHVTELS